MLALFGLLCYNIISHFLMGGKIMLALVIIHIIVAIALVAIVLLQSGKTAGLSGTISGGAETFFGKNKGRTIDAVLAKVTSAAAVVFLVTSLLILFLGK